MCGISGIFAYDRAAPPVERDELARITAHMRPRGPDAEGTWLSEDGRVALGHRRLAIIDLSAGGNQPMASTDGALRLVFNGEIYNHRQLRAELTGRGFEFRSASDTEVILALYETLGVQMLERLRGMFALALWDGRQRRLLLARDPFGIKPLYFASNGGVVRVASQVRALLAGGRVSREIDPAGHVGFYLWGHVPEPHTLYREIQQLEAGSYAWVGEGGVRDPVRYWHPSSAYEREESVSDPAAHVGAALRESVTAHFESDVPVGIFLSSGLDSSVLVALATELRGHEIQSVTLGFEEFRGTPWDEVPLAEEVARHYGTRHTTVRIRKADFLAAVPRILASMDQPSIDGVNTYLVSQAAKECGLKVVLSGLGGDELFGGYPSFRRVPRMVRAFGAGSVAAAQGAQWAWLFDCLPLGRRRQKVRAMLQLGGTFEGAYFVQRGLFMPWELPQVLDPEVVRAGLRLYDPLEGGRRHLPQGTSFAKVAVLEQCLYMRSQLLRDADWAGMAHSLEIRVPLVDSALHEALAPVTQATFEPARPKRWLAAAPGKPLPRAILTRPKTGFTLPMGEWLEADSGRFDTWTKAWAARCIRELAES